MNSETKPQSKTLNNETANNKQNNNKQNKQKILVVDDEPNIVNLIKLTLQNHYNIVPAYSGEEALELIEKHNPELVLLDIMMPKMSGYEVLQKIRMNKVFTDVPVVFLTAKGEWKDKMKALSVGGSNDYITKPFEPDDLLLRVKTILKN